MTQNGKRALLLGATGLTGGHCLKLLLADPAFTEVRVLTRRPLGLQHAKLREFFFDGDLHDQLDTFAVDVVFCCLGTTLKKAGSRESFRKVDFTLCVMAASLARRAGVSTFVAISAVNANPRALGFYARTKGEMEEALRTLGFPHLIFARPSLLLGERSEARLLEGLGQRLSAPLVPLLGRLGSASTPISAGRLARALVNASLQPQAAPVLVLRYPELVQLADSYHSTLEE